MTVSQRLSVLLIFLDIVLAFPIIGGINGRYYTLLNYPMAQVVEPFYDPAFTAICLFGHIVTIPLFLLSYFSKNDKESKKCFIAGAIIMSLMLTICANEYHFAHIAANSFNPETVQSTMVEIDLQQLEDLQDSTEETMIYFGRPSCAHCNEIKPNLDILVNNSHSLVYYYNTEQDREDNHDAMQAVLDTYNVGTVPALAVCDNTSNTQEVYYDEEIVDYFLDTSKFKY